MRKRKPAVKRPRRSTFENSLDFATAKLDKCLARRLLLESELEALKNEIPYLQTVIRALTPKEQNFTYGSQPRNGGVGAAITPMRGKVGTSVPSTIAPFLQPISGNIDEMPDEADKFLDAAKLPPGEDLLS